MHRYERTTFLLYYNVLYLFSCIMCPIVLSISGDFLCNITRKYNEACTSTTADRSKGEMDFIKRPGLRRAEPLKIEESIATELELLLIFPVVCRWYTADPMVYRLTFFVLFGLVLSCVFEVFCNKNIKYILY